MGLPNRSITFCALQSSIGQQKDMKINKNECTFDMYILNELKAKRA